MAKPSDVLALIHRTRGASSKVAAEMGISRATVSLWRKRGVPTRQAEAFLRAAANVIDPARQKDTAP